MPTHLTAQAMDLATYGRAAASRGEATVTNGQRAVIAGLIGVTFLGALAFGRLQSSLAYRDAEILSLEQARFDLETHLHDAEYRLRVLWDDVRAAEAKAAR